MITLLITVLGSLTLIGSLSYLFINKMGLIDSNKSLNQSNSGKFKLEYHDDPNAFRCMVDPRKDIYYINVDTLESINKFYPIDSIDRYGNVSGEFKGRAIVSNTKDDLKDMISDILKERIMDPEYPKSIRVDFVIPDRFVCHDALKNIEVINSSDMAKFEGCNHEGLMMIRKYNKDILFTWFETEDEYMDKQNELNRKKESDRLNGILKQLENINKL